MDHPTLDHAIRRLAPLHTAVAGTTLVASLAALLVLRFWGHPTQRFWLLMACLAVAVAGLVVLVVYRVRTPRFYLGDVFRHLLDRPDPAAGSGPSRDPALPAALPRSRHRLRTVAYLLGVGSWTVPGFFMLSMADTRPPDAVEELLEAGAVVDTLTVQRAYGVETTRFDSTRKHNTLYTQALELTVPGTDGDYVVVQTHGYTQHRSGDEIRAIYSPDNLGMEGYAGPRERGEYAGGTQGYASDIDRIYAGRALSGQQFTFGVVVWLIFAAAPLWMMTRATTDPTHLELKGSRAVRAVFRSDRLHAPGMVAPFERNSPEHPGVTDALEGRTVWLCWDPRRGRKYSEARKNQPVRRGFTYPAAVVFDNGATVYGAIRVEAPTDARTVGAEIGGEHAPVDPTRRVRLLVPRVLWPLSMGWSALAWFALSALLSGVLFSDLVSGFYARLAVAAVGCLALTLGVVFRTGPETRPRTSRKGGVS